MPEPTIHPGLFILGEALRKRRRARGLHQHDIARKMNISPSAVSRWEDGKRWITTETLCWLLGLLETPPDDYHFLLSLRTLCDSTCHVEHSTTGMSSLHRAYHQHARQIFEWAPRIVPEILQTTAYTRHLTTGPDHNGPPPPVRRLGPTRSPLRHHALLLGDAALALKTVPSAVLQDQLDYLSPMTRAEQREVRIVRALHTGTVRPFTIYTITARSSTVVLRHQHTTTYLSDPETVRQYEETITTLQRHSTNYATMDPSMKDALWAGQQLPQKSDDQPFPG